MFYGSALAVRVAGAPEQLPARRRGEVGGGRELPAGVARPGGAPDPAAGGDGRACARPSRPGRRRRPRGTWRWVTGGAGAQGPAGSPARPPPRAAGSVSSPVFLPRGGRQGGSPVRPAGSPALPAAHPPGVGGEPSRRRGAVAGAAATSPARPSARPHRGDKSGQREAKRVFRCRGRQGRASLGARRPRVSAGHGGQQTGQLGRRDRPRGAGCRGARRRYPPPPPRRRLCSPLLRPLPFHGPPSCSGVFISACLFLGWKIKGLARRPLAVTPGAK